MIFVPFSEKFPYPLACLQLTVEVPGIGDRSQCDFGRREICGEVDENLLVDNKKVLLTKAEFQPCIYIGWIFSLRKVVIAKSLALCTQFK